MNPGMTKPHSTLYIIFAKLICLLPTLLTLLYVKDIAFATVLFTIMISCLASEQIISFIFKRHISKAHYLDTALHALVLSICMPLSAPIWLMAFTSAASIILTRVFYGGFGQHLFQPAMLGLAIITLVLPNTFQPIFLIENSAKQWLFFIVLIPGFFLLLRKIIPNEAAIAFIFSSMVLYGNSLILNSIFPTLNIYLPAFHEYFVLILLLGVFVITDAPTSGMLRSTRNMLGIITAAMVFFAYLLTHKTLSFAYAILLGNVMLPWLEQHYQKKLVS
jgi:Na+-translocating ferredoxin:NAD+ oxidoreductase RnfD subunit